MTFRKFLFFLPLCLLGQSQMDYVKQIKNKPVIDVREFGAKGNGTTDDTSSIQNALTTGAGNIIYIPAGIYKITAILNIPSNTTVKGAGIESTYIKQYSNTDGAFKIGNGVSLFGGSSIEDMWIEVINQKIDTIGVDITYSNNITISNVWFERWHIGAQVGGPDGNHPSFFIHFLNCWFNGTRGLTPSTAFGIKTFFSGDTVVHGCYFFGNSNYPAILTATNSNTVQLTASAPHGLTGTEELTVGGFTGAWAVCNMTAIATILSPSTFTIPCDSTSLGPVVGSPYYGISEPAAAMYTRSGITVEGNTNTYHHGTGITIAPNAGEDAAQSFISDTVIDSGYRTGAQGVRIVSADTSKIGEVFISDTWISMMNRQGVFISASTSGEIDTVHITGSHIGRSGFGGIIVNSTGPVKHLLVSDSIMAGNSELNINNNPDIYIDGSVVDSAIRNNQLGNGLRIPEFANYGVMIRPNSNPTIEATRSVIVSGNSFSGYLTDSYFDDSSIPRKLIQGNLPATANQFQGITKTCSTTITNMVVNNGIITSLTCP